MPLRDVTGLPGFVWGFVWQSGILENVIGIGENVTADNQVGSMTFMLG
jgi:hypothetical protein